MFLAKPFALGMRLILVEDALRNQETPAQSISSDPAG
jgi:hypothetical protein